MMTFFRNYIRDNPLCDLCGVVKDETHYVFHCRKFTIKRQVLNDTVRVFLAPEHEFKVFVLYFEHFS